MDKNSTPLDIAKPSSAGSKVGVTKYVPTGIRLPVVQNPIDILYFCHKMESAKRNPYLTKNGMPRYQRQVTKWIRQDALNANYNFPYCGEVGFNMTTEPPTPLTSKNEPHRPSHFPLSKYRMIYRFYRELNRYNDPEGCYLFDFRGVEVVDPFVNKTELENSLALKRSGDNDVVEAYRTLNPEVANARFPNGRGMIRIPDVIKKKNHTLLGKEGYSVDNIDMVIEIKFPGDSLSDGQKKDYLKIASYDVNKFRLMTLDQCQYRRRRRQSEEEELLADAKADPLYQVIGEAAFANPPIVNLIEIQMQQEYDAISKHIIKWVTEQEIKYSGPQMMAADSYNLDNLKRAWQQFEQRSDAIINAPLASVGVAALGASIALSMSNPATLSTAAVSRFGAEVITFPTITKATVAATAAAALPLAAQPNHRYILEPDGKLTYFADISQQTKYSDDRLIEIDYFYKKPLVRLYDYPVIHRIYDHSSAVDNDLQFEHNGQRHHVYPYRQQFYYYFTPGDEPTSDE